MNACGHKHFELTNLPIAIGMGNVLVVITDQKHATCQADTITHYTAQVTSATDYSPFGAPLAGRTWYGYMSGGYRYGFNSMERDDEVKGSGNSYDFGARVYDPRLGRWLSVDPLMKRYADMTTFNAFGNNPIVFIDPDGRSIIISTKDGTQDERLKAFNHLQSLTNDKLIMDEKGKIIILALGGENPDKDLNYGTQLIRNLVQDEQHKVDIIIVKPNKFNQTTAADPDGAQIPGIGSDSYIEYNPEADGITKGAVIKNRDGSYGRPAKIGLAHELLHARINAKGRNNTTPQRGLVDPDGGYEVGKITKTELDVRIEENIIREEQDVIDRDIPN